MTPLTFEELYEAAQIDIKNVERLALFMGLPLPRTGLGYTRRLISAIIRGEAQITPSKGQEPRAYSKAWTTPTSP